ncbi:GIY-YIG nuclease family protein [Aliifodinibius sp. S!AR15-10]|uniref:GIY-YIG nuclease family protein n=1 Tax=Aliifodinibius sp. S!AR15-10 TaxID=2950437 RepID=UPI0028575C58|nr:GIY-YIG nuclease family protein [Aliifodinibius sp. S!AR15-10]MDR8393371.1 GIY-YIG nuclease family protein [Aliifodinibius sp. S!AR15-10]
MKDKYTVYIMTNRHNTVLYTGVTNDIVRRCWEHKHKLADGFTKRYNIDKLIYVEHFRSPQKAIEREKQIKGWKRKKKEALINRLNPDWVDLYDEVCR